MSSAGRPAQDTSDNPPPTPVGPQFPKAALICPICQDTPTGPFRTPCDHLFCYECIRAHLLTRSTCPTCAAFLTLEALRPDFLADSEQRTPELSRPALTQPPSAPRWGGRGAGARARGEMGGRREEARRALGDLGGARSISGADLEATLHAADQMSAEAIERVIATLSSKLERKKDLTTRRERELLSDFLARAFDEKQEALTRIIKQLDMLADDIRGIGMQVPSRHGKRGEGGSPWDPALGKRKRRRVSDLDDREDRVESEISARTPRDGSSVSTEEGGSAIGGGSAVGGDSTVGGGSTAGDGGPPTPVPRRKYSREVFDEFQERYFNIVGTRQGNERSVALKGFMDDMYKFTQYSKLRCRATLKHTNRPSDTPGSDAFNASNIVCWIEFDRDSEFIATAGVTKRIKIYEFSNILRDITPVHYPVKEISTRAKLSCLSWNSYIRNHMVSSDYDGNITLWDAHRGVSLNEYEEHEKRAWSVDFSRLNPTMFASASDDGRVKIWSTNQINSVLTINNRENVCSVRFNPGCAEKIAFGSLDQCVHYYDLRNTRHPLHVFREHSKTVSYVNFLSETDLVSTCVDSTIKLWDLRDFTLAKTFTGHTNEKNFVGLSVNADYISCGSEDNSLYAYYKAISTPFAKYKFCGSDLLTGAETEDSTGTQFVSSVCWCPKFPTMCLGANSRGIIKILELEQ